ncbi:MAG: Omp28-related outer membrane protein [Bacteroidales bacterium]|nr:Omp28-related outer membrane protein [Bacteroidales bacterium]
MKKNILFLGLLLTASAAVAQTFVPTTPQKRNALIEEYTGVNCQYCPLGHKLVDEMMATYPGHVYGINIHQGSFASRYTTQWGNALAQQAGIQGYPSSTLNRHAFKGSSIQIDPGENYRYVPQVLQMDAPVNVAAVVNIDPETRLMTVNVEVYYTANSATDFNLLNVALLQSNVFSSQAGSSYYPENMVNGQYNHKHMLRDLLTGQWGDTISQTTAGSFFSKEYAYVVPNTLGGVNITNLDDLTVLVFVCENHKEVLNVTEAVRAADKARLSYVGVDQDVCVVGVQPYVTVENCTANPISNLAFTVDGTPLTSSKTIAAYVSDTIHLPLYLLDPLPADHQHYSASRSVVFSGYSSNGQTVSLSGEESTFSIADFDLYTAPGPLTLSIHYDGYPTETSFSLLGYDSCAYYYENTGLSNQGNRTVEYTLSPSTAGVYRLRLTDVGGDGVSGTISVTDADGNTLFSRNGSSLSRWDYYFNITTPGTDGPQSPVGIGEVADVQLSAYPNPTTGIVYIDAEGLRSMEVLDMSGRMALRSSLPTLDLTALPAGIYVLRVVTDDGVAVKRIVKK